MRLMVLLGYRNSKMGLSNSPVALFGESIEPGDEHGLSMVKKRKKTRDASDQNGTCMYTGGVGGSQSWSSMR